MLGAAIALAVAGGCSGGGDESTGGTEIQADKHIVMSDGLLPQTAAGGWIEEFLERQASGLTGHPDALSYPYNTCLWNGQIKRNTDSYGCEWWRYEQTAYYSDGLLRLGYLLNNDEFVKKVTDGIEYTLANADENGRLG